MLFLERIRKERKSLGLSQAELSRISGVSLPTIQNIERGVANPSLSTLQSLLKVLGLTLTVDNASVDWETLISCGLPMLQKQGVKVRASRRLLIESLRLALCDLHRYGQKYGQHVNHPHIDRVNEDEAHYEYVEDHAVYSFNVEDDHFHENKICDGSKQGDGAMQGVAEKYGEYERKRESVCALLLALKTHYGGVFEKNFAKMPVVKGLLDNCPTGRILKLRRIALSKLAEYL